MYAIEQLLENYREDEMGEGAALALGDPIRVKKKKGKYVSDGCIWIEEDVGKHEKQKNYAQVCLDPARGELVEAHCSCEDFTRDTYACPHIIALQTAWLLKEYGREALAQSPLKEILVRRTGLADPFAPGILRKTSESLRGWLASATQNESGFRLAERSSDEPFGTLRIELTAYQFKEHLFELKVGNRRAYIVKDAYDFLDAFEKEKRLTFGKSLSFTAREEAFDEKGKRLLSFLREMFREEREDRNKVMYFRTHNTSGRYIRIAGRDFDTLMERCGGDGIYLEDGKAAYFSPEPYRIGVRIAKQEYGAVLSVQGEKLLTATPGWLYLLADGEIRRTKRAGQEAAEQLFALAETGEELYVSERDLPGLCRNVLADMAENTDIRCTGMSLAGYLPEKPAFRWYLDLVQEDMISCRAVACYGEREYSLATVIGEGENRDLRAEKEAAERLLRLFQAYEEETESFICQGDAAMLYEFLTERLPVLAAMGEVFVSDAMKKLRVRPVSRLDVGVSIDGGLLRLSVAADAFTRDELFEILSAYRPKKRFYRLRDGSFIPAPGDQEAIWEALSDCLKDGKKPGKEEWKLPLFRAMYLDEALRERDGVSYSRDREYRRLVGRMREAQNSTDEPPESLAGILRGYQADGFRWIKTLKDNGFGGILADDMGLGKTLQVQAFLLSEWEAGRRGDAMRTLVVTPASLLYNWKQELARYTPELPVRVIAGTAKEREEQIAAYEEHDGVWLTSYDLLKRDILFYENVPFANEVLDEAQYVKNQGTHAAKSVRLIRSGFRLALTGTPIENRLSELWSLFDYLMPGFLFPYARFREEIELPVVSSGDKDALDKLRRMVHPFILRRLKKEVLKELPDKLEEEMSVQLAGEQRDLYLAHAQRLRMYLEKQTPEEFAHGKLEILAELTKLRQLCCDPALLAENYTGENAKLDACMELLHRAVDGGHKVLLFSQFTSMLDIIGARLSGEGIRYHRIDGSVKKEERMRMVDSFDTDDVPVFCISLKAGGTGLNLTAADIVIHYDPWWNLAAQNQATDRTHRIGQTHVVTVYRLIAADTVEERIAALQKSKYQLAEDVLSGEGISSILIDKEQVLSLLQA